MKPRRVINLQSPMLLRSIVHLPHHLTSHRFIRRPTQPSITPPPPLLPGTNPSGITSRAKTSRQSPTPCLKASSPTTRRCTTNMTQPRPLFLLSPTSLHNLKRFLILKSFQNIIQNTRRHTTIQLFLIENPTHQNSQMFLTTTSFQNTPQQPRPQPQQPTLLLQLLPRLQLLQLPQQQPRQPIQLLQQQLQPHIQLQPTRQQQLQPQQQHGTNQ